MKNIAAILSFVLLASPADSKETIYTASTPAGSMVRTFLGISLSDSVDFIRWRLSLTDVMYKLECNYGIGRPNTNGFVKDGKKVVLTGAVKRQENIYILQNKNAGLRLAELNANLLHILNEDNRLLIGNGGWSYTINRIDPSINDKSTISAKQVVVSDSAVFEGRTPCGVPGIIERGKECYKLKWLIVLYGNAAKNEPTSYKIIGTPYRAEGGRRGNWTITSGRNGQISYHLIDEKGKPFIHLLKLDEGVLVFTDAKGNLLVGDLDFSYTLNRRS
ncbi:MAG TPA: hypothetical protein VFH08_11665 [Chitinophagaceae bacterium]|nr:hypothetical protein [Chitinophagaceae bacterium]